MFNTIKFEYILGNKDVGQSDSYLMLALYVMCRINNTELKKSPINLL